MSDLPTLPRVDLLNSREVPAAFELGGEPDPDDRQRFVFGHGALANRQDVTVVVRAVPDRELWIPAHAATDATLAIRDDRLAVAGAAEDDAALKLAAGHRLCNRPDEIRIVAGRVGIRTKIAHRM